MAGVASFAPVFGDSPPAAIRNAYGEVGLLDMPGGRMAPDGELAFNIGDIGHMQRYALTFQALPWLQADFRYSHIPNYGGMRSYYDKSFGIKVRVLNETQFLPDLSIGIRDVVGTGVYGSEYVVASKHVGPFDLTAGMGWGRLADDKTASNPFGHIIPSFDNPRSASLVLAVAGTVDFKRFFHGPNVGVFGGASWQSPINGLSVIAEYSSDHYTEEAKTGFHTRSPVNVGLSYAAFDVVTLSAGWYYGKFLGLGLNIHGDTTKTVPSALRIGPAIPTPALRNDQDREAAIRGLHSQRILAGGPGPGKPFVDPSSERQRATQIILQALQSATIGVRGVEALDNSLIVDARLESSASAQCARYAKIASAIGTQMTALALTDLDARNSQTVLCAIGTHSVSIASDSGAEGGEADWARFENTLRNDLGGQDIALKAVTGSASQVWVYYENYRYAFATEAAGRIIRVLMTDAPASIEVFHLIQANQGIPTRALVVTRSGAERMATNSFPDSTMLEAVAVTLPSMHNPALDLAVPQNYPVFAWSLDPKMAEHVFDPEAPIQFQFYAQAAGVAEISPGLAIETVLTSNIWTDYTYSRPSDSELPHVRTDLLQYLKLGRYGISALDVDYRLRLAPTLYGEVRAGIFEDMFAGVGGQLLWRPERTRWSVGIDLYQVWQREYQRLFQLRNYQTITGHANIYYQSPWYDLNFTVRVGRYLAGDTGGTFEITRRFSSGVEIGAWATFTNVPFSKFGEGSFDKGIILHIPLEWSLPIHSQTSFDFYLNTLTRDGGQRLAGDDSLYDATYGTSYGEIIGHMDDLATP